jgi:DNA-binding beta-propeller fold protein YncE
MGMTCARLIAIGALATSLATAAWASTPVYRVTERLPGPDGGWDYVKVDAAHNRLLAPRGGAVMAVDLASGKVTTGLAPGGRQHVALPMAGGREILVTNGASDTAVFVDAFSGAMIAAVPTAKGPDAAATDPKSGLAIVMGHAGGAVTLIDPRQHRSIGTVTVGGALEEAAADGSGRAFVNIEDRNEIAVIDLAAQKVAARWPLPGCDGPTGLAYNPQDRLLIAACDGATALVRTSDGKVVQTLPTGHGADGAVYDAKRRLAFVPAGRDGTLAVIAFADGKARIAQQVTTQRGARTLALDERTGRIYLPTAQYAPPAVAGGRPTPVPGTFEVLVVAPQ